MRLAVCFYQRFWYDGKKYTTEYNFVNLVLSFLVYFNEIHLYVPVCYSKSERGDIGVNIENKNVYIHSIPFARSSLNFYSIRYIPNILKIVIQMIKTKDKWDIAWIIPPHLPAIIFYFVSILFSKKLFVYLRSDFEKELLHHKLKGFSRIKANIGKYVIRFSIGKMIRRNLTFVVGDALFKKYGQRGKYVRKIYPSLISEKSISNYSIRKISKKQNKFKIVYAGRITPEKGLDYLLESIDELVSSGVRDIHLQIIGSGKGEEHFKQKSLKLGIAEYVSFEGYISDRGKLFNILQESHVFVSPALTEAFGKVIVEAMANSLPIISTKVGGIPVEHNKTGLLITPGNSKEITNAILSLKGNNKLRERLSKNCRKEAYKYTLEKFQMQLITSIESHITP